MIDRSGATQLGPAIEARSLTKRFGERTVVDRVSFTVPFGAVTGFVGGNGSGKSTTMRMLLGLTLPTAGAALMAGRPIGEVDDPRRVVGASLDRLGALPGMTARQHVGMVAVAAGIGDARVEEMLAMVGLTDAADRRIATYSTGMRQRLGIATALLADPAVLLLDEPSNGLDPAGISWLREKMRAHADGGGAVFVSTHHLAELESIVDHLVVIADGRLVAAGAMAQVLDAAGVRSIEDLLLQGARS